MARRLACEAGIIPAVLDGDSQVLDLGRKKRFHTEAQRIKATIEQAAATSRAATPHPAMTQMHHPIRWADGGERQRATAS